MRFFTAIFARCGRPARRAALIALALTLPFDAAQAGFFDFLFMPQMAPNPYPYPGVTPQWRGPPRIHKRKAKVKVQEHRRQRRITVTKARPAGLPHAAPTGIMDDHSLQNGDAVMTLRGIRIFAGRSGDRHSPEDFAKLSEIKGLSKSARKDLAAIDAARSEPGARISPRQEIVTGRSAADSSISAGVTIKDPKGRMIRYVGP